MFFFRFEVLTYQYEFFDVPSNENFLYKLYYNLEINK